MIEINCLVCEKPIKFPSYIDSDDYDGHIFCHECNLLLYIRLKSSKVKKYKVVEKQPEVKPNISINYMLTEPRPDQKEQKAE